MGSQVPPSTKFSPLQLELLNTFSFDLTDEELVEIKGLLAQYLFRKWQNNLDKRAQALGITDDDLETWLTEN